VTTTGETSVHHFGLETGQVRGCWNRDFPPVLTIDPGDTVIYSTLDAGWGYVGRIRGYPVVELTREPGRDEGHALNGPLAVRGAKPGDTLVVHIEAVRPGPWGFTWAGPRPQLPRYDLVDGEEVRIDWRIHADAGIATDENGLGVELRLRPFMGVMGNAPAEPGDHSTAPPRPVGGNLDCRELIAGSTLFLPVAVEGALFSLGDGHATQGDGEVGQTAIECPMEEVRLRFELRRDRQLDAPEAETPAGYLTMGMGETLDEAASMALAGMLSHLQRQFGLTRAQAMALASVAVDLRVTQVVNQQPGVHAILPPDVVSVCGRS
jgi:acetamidase/formamidase